MLAVFLSEDGHIMFTYPDEAIFLCPGDVVRFGEREYAVTKKCFVVDASVTEFVIREIEDSSEHLSS